jgi:hypothetical protein
VNTVFKTFILQGNASTKKKKNILLLKREFLFYCIKNAYSPRTGERRAARHKGVLQNNKGRVHLKIK